MENKNGTHGEESVPAMVSPKFIFSSLDSESQVHLHNFNFR